ncbi:MAG: glycosyltransferase family 2 protein [Candidatus Nanohaloarchaea archaeon]
MKASVIIPTYDRPDYLRQTLQSLAWQTTDEFEVIVVNDSEDEVNQRIVEEYNERYDIPFRHLWGGGGVSAARNKGVEHAETENILFLDDDTLAPEIWVESMVENVQQAEPDVDIVAGQLLPVWLGGEPDWYCEEALAPKSLAPVWSRGDEPEVTESVATPADNTLVKREAFTAVDGFDTNLGQKEGSGRTAPEDVAFCARLQEQKSKMLYVPLPTYHLLPAERVPDRSDMNMRSNGISSGISSATLTRQKSWKDQLFDFVREGFLLFPYHLYQLTAAYVSGNTYKYMLNKRWAYANLSFYYGFVTDLVGDLRPL